MQIWVPDTRRPNFADECRCQSRLVGLADQEGRDLHDLMEAALVDAEGWTACRVRIAYPGEVQWLRVRDVVGQGIGRLSWRITGGAISQAGPSFSPW